DAFHLGRRVELRSDWSHRNDNRHSQALQETLWLPGPADTERIVFLPCYTNPLPQRTVRHSMRTESHWRPRDCRTPERQYCWWRQFSLKSTLHRPSFAGSSRIRNSESPSMPAAAPHHLPGERFLRACVESCVHEPA